MTDEPSLFIDSILALAPKTAAFDCDGTLWDADSGMEFFYWLLDHGLVDAATDAWARPRYQDYLAGRVDEQTMCGEMVQICRGMRMEVVTDAARAFFREKVEARIFPEMLQLTSRLRELGCELWAVSSSNQWLIEVEAAPFGFAADHVLAAATEVEDGLITGRLLRVPTGPGKATALKEHAQRPVELAFGNSIHDLAMLESATHPFVIAHNPDLAELARMRGWPIYHPTL
ncbi:MAG: HAD-IB family phosphatase [Acidobacteriota bacterium]|nr:HAD-IB family phosphatase [Acidobacteriota bacterium]